MSAVIEFGKYNNETLKWDVIWEDDYKKLLFCKKSIGNWSLGSDNWASCNLRKYLNGDFLKNSFSDEERKRIVNAKVKTDSGWVKDDIFIMSYEESCEWLKDKDFSNRGYAWILTRSKYNNSSNTLVISCVDDYIWDSDKYNVYPMLYLKK